MAKCQKCGAQNREGVRFCTSCGNPMNSASKQHHASGKYPARNPQAGYPSGNYGSPSQTGSAGYLGRRQPGSFFCTDPISMWTYAGMIILAALCPIGIIVALVCGFGESTSPDFSRFCKYYLLFSPIGLIMALVYAFGSESDYNLKTLSKGYLIVCLFSIAIGMLFMIVSAVSIGSIFWNYY